MEVDLSKLSQKVMTDDVITKYSLNSASKIYKSINPYLKIGTKPEEMIRLIHPILIQFINRAFDRDQIDFELNKFLYEQTLLCIADEYIKWHKDNQMTGNNSKQFLYRDNKKSVGTILSLNMEVVNILKLRLFNEFLDSFNDTKIEIIINTFLNTTNKTRDEIKSLLRTFIITKIEIAIMLIIRNYYKAMNRSSIYDYCMVQIQELKFAFSSDHKRKKPKKEE